MSEQTRYYIDMDGVLVKYDRNAYIGSDPMYKRKNAHYYRDLQPDFRMLEFTDKLMRFCQRTDNELYVLSSLPMQGPIFNEQFHDKILWLSRWMPYIDIDHILLSVTSKRDAVEYIHNHQLTPNDILIDDYNKNLNEWKDADGTAVKYCNGLNNPDSFSGIKLHENISVDSMIDIVCQINERLV